MSRRGAAHTQAGIARIIRAAKQAGAASVEVNPDGKIIIVLNSPPLQDSSSNSLDDELAAFEARHGQG